VGESRHEGRAAARPYTREIERWTPCPAGAKVERVTAKAQRRVGSQQTRLPGEDRAPLRLGVFAVRLPIEAPHVQREGRWISVGGILSTDSQNNLTQKVKTSSGIVSAEAARQPYATLVGFLFENRSASATQLSESHVKEVTAGSAVRRKTAKERSARPGGRSLGNSDPRCQISTGRLPQRRRGRPAPDAGSVIEHNKNTWLESQGPT
jgi:hypothetical protein